MKRKLFIILFAATLIFSLTACTSQDLSKVNMHSPDEAISDWQVAVQLLKDGNQRYLDNKGIKRDTNAADRNVLKDGQKPFAVVLTCSDSRVSPEIYFDQKLGDIFVVRNAGDIADAAALGSIEYAVEHLKAPLVVVAGHSKCGAVTAAVQGGHFPDNLQFILDNIKDTVQSNDVDTAIHENIDGVVAKIQANEIVEEAEVTVVGAYYDIETGKISWNE